MKINRNNCEAWLLDMMEGRLNDEETRLLREFLSQHPECDPGETTGADWTLEARKVRFEGKEELKKSFPAPDDQPTVQRFDMFSIARLEGDLLPEQERAHEALVAGDVELRKEWESWRKTRIDAEEIPFPEKSKLLKKEISGDTGRRINPTSWIAIVSAAAAVALVLLVLRNIAPEVQGELAGSQLTIAEKAETLPSGADRTGTRAPSDGDEQSEIQNAPPQTDGQARNPVTLRIRKHQEPPELTGKDRDVGVAAVSDTTKAVIASRTRTRPVDFTMASLQTDAIAKTGSYDRIAVLDLPPMESNRESFSLSAISRKGIRQASSEYLREKDVSLLDIASAGVEGFSRLTGAEISFGITRDANGKITVVRFRSDLLSVDAPIKQPE